MRNKRATAPRVGGAFAIRKYEIDKSEIDRFGEIDTVPRVQKKNIVSISVELSVYKSSARAPLGAREGFEQTIGGVQRGLLLPNERFRRSEPRCLGVRPQMTGRSEEGARCRPRRGERRWNGGRLCVFGASIFRSDGVCQLGTERIRRATSIEFSVAAFISDPFRSHCEEGTLLGTRSV